MVRKSHRGAPAWFCSLKMIDLGCDVRRTRVSRLIIVGDHVQIRSPMLMLSGAHALGAVIETVNMTSGGRNFPHSLLVSRYVNGQHNGHKLDISNKSRQVYCSLQCGNTKSSRQSRVSDSPLDDMRPWQP
jgi:hypothetical protein